MNVISKIGNRDHIVTPITVSTGPTDGSKAVQTKADGTLDASFLPPGVGEESITRLFAENVTAPAVVLVVAGELVAADASVGNASRAMQGFITNSGTTGVAGKMYYGGISSGWSGLTVDAPYFLAAASGDITDTPITTAGQTHQYFGTAISATEILVEVGAPYILGE